MIDQRIIEEWRGRWEDRTYRLLGGPSVPPSVQYTAEGRTHTASYNELIEIVGILVHKLKPATVLELTTEYPSIVEELLKMAEKDARAKLTAEGIDPGMVCYRKECPIREREVMDEAPVQADSNAEPDSQEEQAEPEQGEEVREGGSGVLGREESGDTRES